jgi:competence transcription factor ComK
MTNFKSFDAFDQETKVIKKRWINVKQIVEFSDNGNNTTRVKLSNGEWFDLDVNYPNIEHYITGLKSHNW